MIVEEGGAHLLLEFRRTLRSRIQREVTCCVGKMTAVGVTWGQQKERAAAASADLAPAPARAMMMTPPLPRKQVHKNSNKIVVPLTLMRVWGVCTRVMEVEADKASIDGVTCYGYLDKDKNEA